MQLLFSLVYTSWNIPQEWHILLTVELYIAIISTLALFAAVASVVLIWPKLTITVGFKRTNKPGRDVFELRIHNGRRSVISIYKTGFLIANGKDLKRNHYHDSMGQSTVIIKPGGDYTEEWQFEDDERCRLRRVWLEDSDGNPKTGKIPKNIRKRLMAK
jgi:hypothetical protein